MIDLHHGGSKRDRAAILLWEAGHLWGRNFGHIWYDTNDIALIYGQGGMSCITSTSFLFPSRLKGFHLLLQFFILLGQLQVLQRKSVFVRWYATGMQWQQLSWAYCSEKPGYQILHLFMHLTSLVIISLIFTSLMIRLQQRPVPFQQSNH